jgi:phosphohistidine phosphatase
MKRLVLVRHGQAEWRDPALPDVDRPLTRRGLAEAATMARRVAADETLVPQRILTSPALRTTQTAAAFAREAGLADRNVFAVAMLYLAPPDALLAAVRDTGAQIERLMLVGHNPGLSEFARLLAPDAGLAEFETGATCAFEWERTDWQIEYSTAERANYDTPGRFFDLWH